MLKLRTWSTPVAKGMGWWLQGVCKHLCWKPIGLFKGQDFGSTTTTEIGILFELWLLKSEYSWLRACRVKEWSLGNWEYKNIDLAKNVIC